jgi:excisionase family DNA binding protein
MQQLFVSKRQLCMALGLSLSTLNRLIKSGSVPFVKVGQRVLIPVEYIEKLAANAMSDIEA